MSTLADRVREQVNNRPCHICRQLGPCAHREYQVEIAIARAEEKAEKREEALRDPDVVAALKLFGWPPKKREEKGEV